MTAPEGVDPPVVYPTSFAQQRLWTVAQLDGEHGAYTVPIALRLDGELRADALCDALAGAVRRHDALRTGFLALNGQPVQVVHPTVPFTVVRSDLTCRNPDDAMHELRDRLVSDAATPFDLAVPPLVRARLTRLGTDRHVLSLCLHHIVVDEWSIGLLLTEVATRYTAAVEGRTVTLPGPAGSYREYARRQRLRLSPARLERLRGYWRERMAGAPEVLMLPTDRPRPGTRTFRGGSARDRIPAATRDELVGLARDCNATLFVVLLTGLAAVLSRNSGQADVIIGTSVADRTDGTFDDVIGFFVNTVAVRTDLAGRPTFRELVGRTWSRWVEAYEHQDLPFEKLVELLQPARTAAYHPVFQVMVTLQNSADLLPRIAGLNVTELLYPSTGGMPFDLSLSVVDRPDGLDLNLRYSTDLFDAGTAGRLLAQLRVLLTAAAGEPHRPVARLPLVEPTEPRRPVPDTPAGSPVARHPDDCLPAMVEDQARRTPDAVAVTAGDTRLSYRELDSWANRIAHRLREIGVGAEVLVGLAARRGTSLITAIQAVWRAGGAFVPLDPDQPAERQRAVLRQARCRVLLVDDAGRRELAETLAGLPEPDRPILVDLDPAAHQGHPGTPLPRAYRADGLAYVIFTSGTTGAPKGAMVSHAGMRNHVSAKNGDVNMAGTDVLAQNGPATFDVVVWQCCAPLVLGGRIHVVPDAAAGDPELLANELARGGVTVLQAVPSAIRLLLTINSPDHRLDTLRWLVSTGDALPTEMANRWLAEYPDVALLNTYGVTECSDDQYHWAVGASLTGGAAPIVPIGAPVAGMSGYVLDGELEPVPVGVQGELHLGGVGVGRGYLGRPELTADRFVPDPYGRPGTRMYRTGDLVRQRGDAPLEFVGRADFQLKVRGFRIEASEVEAALCRHPSVRESVVVGHGAAGPERRLVGYLVADGDRVPDATLRRFVAGLLPDYMVPHDLIWLDRLPVTQHGKVDRAALPAPSPVDSTPPEATDEVSPCDPIADLVAGMWCQVLGREYVDPRAEFFHLGGTSLLAVELLNRLRAGCGVRLSLAELLKDATVTGVADTVRLALRNGAEGAVLTPIPRVDRDAPTHLMRMSFAQERLWVIEQLAESPALYAVPFVLRLSISLDDAALAGAVDRLLDRHEALRTGLEQRDGHPVQVIHSSVPTPLTIDDLTHLPAEERDGRAGQLLSADARAGFDLGRPPLLRIRAVRMGRDTLLLGIVVHHAVTDAWSNDVLVRDLIELLRAAADGRAERLPELPIQYADYATWQRHQLTPERLAELLGHWRQRMAGMPELCTLPADRPRPATQSHRGRTERMTIPPDVVDAARELERAEGVTTFMVLLSALYALLYRLSGQRDLVVGAPTAGREHPQSHDLVGCFVNTLPLRLEVSGRQSFRAVLRQVRQVCLDAYAHADLPFDALVDKLGLPRSIAHHPVFQVMLSLRSLPTGDTDRPTIVEPLALDTGTARFDLAFQVTELAEGWRVDLEYASDLFDPDTVRRFGTALGELLAAAVADQDRPVGLLPLLSEPQRRAIESWVAGRRIDRAATTLPELVAAQASRTPDAPAVGMSGRWLSYREFWSAVTALAARLRELGLGPDQVVGVCLERGIDRLVAVHAVVAAGAAYLPLDPGYPTERLHVLAGDAGAAAVICGAAQRSRLRGCDVPLVDPAGGPHLITEPALPAVPVDCLAYVIHTSGSTGRPKGVQISHRAVVNQLRWMQDAIPVGPRHPVLHKTPFGFDVSVWELFWPLTVGAPVVLAEPGAQRDPRRLSELINAERVGTAIFVPSMLGPFLDTVEAPDGAGQPPAALERVICIGESLPPQLAERFLRVVPGVALHNTYGPTEAAIAVTWQPLPSAPDVVPIGRPIANTRLEILDGEGQRTPVGVSGQVYLGGVQLARGYARRSGLTAERFLPDPAGIGDRLYATGDIGRWRADGTVELLGRSDDQVKIRGFRVEPAEVEAALLSHPAVDAVAVVARSGRLAAYLVPAAGAELPTPAELRGHLSARLPEYLLPSWFLPVARLPLTPNGKLDRAALPAPGTESDAAAAAYVVPAEGPQRVLAEIWSGVLGVERVGAHDNFFALGGDSIMSMLVVSQAARAGLRLTLRQFFEHQTVADLAAFAQPTSAGAARPATAGRGAASRVDATTFGRVVAALRAEDESTGGTDGEPA